MAGPRVGGRFGNGVDTERDAELEHRVGGELVRRIGSALERNRDRDLAGEVVYA